ncbi:putative leucine-rich repeat-containing protein DDB_G0290503 isoform X2 [Macadamia integrifolia]|uniref:putative leucine-rich repeat-containing protein DDB_G0290503 isoform X2 n=1 Tax=Macadamia integrifolia TaxID=60698 RepID=UPI001C4F2343|nr:putative leucine-rich repeat-containing protein DDB_G0290503 isoform X2 [Macadamia integrifolia]
MELLRLSKFKLQLRSLITEVQELKERDNCSREQLNRLIQKQKQTEEEYSRKLQALQAELVSSEELRHKLERKVKHLQEGNALLENKQKDLKGTIDGLLQSRESFISLYEDSTCEMRRSIETKDRKLAVLSDKLLAHLLLFESIEKEATSVKQLLDNVQQVVAEKEEVVGELKTKLNKVSAIHRDFVEKISFMENKLRINQDELRRKDTVISELGGQLEVANLSNNFQSQIEELQKALSLKEDVIQNLMAEKKALHYEAQSTEIILQKIQQSIMNMNAEDKRFYSSVLDGKEECAEMGKKENNRTGYMLQEIVEDSPYKDPGQRAAENTASPMVRECNSENNPLQENCNFQSCFSGFACSPRQSACSDPQSTANVIVVKLNEKKANWESSLHQIDSENSTTSENQH